MTRRVHVDAALSGLLVALLAAQVGAFIVSHSNTFDEPAVIGAGYSYVRTGRIELETKVHPPLMKYLFGLFVSIASPSFDAQSPALQRDWPYAFGHDFLFHNRVKPEVILGLARLASLLLSLALAACLWFWARHWFGPWGGVLALAAYVFEPNIIAHSGLANMDLGLTAFLFMGYFLLVRYLENPQPWRLLLSGALAGCALASKIPGAFFFAWSAPLIWFWKRKPSQAIKANLSLLLVALFVLLTLYQFRFAPKLGGLLGQMLPAVFVEKHATEQHYNFLLGQAKLGGWRHYYLVALAVKTSLPFLALVGLGFWKGLDKKERQVVGWPALSYLLLCSLASKQNGLRYVLPIFPFLCLAVGSLARRKSRKMVLAVSGLLAWSALETLSIAPHYLAYFNELAGGPANGYKILVDSNLDWGQDYPQIADLLRRNGDPEIIVACLGNADRDHYLGPHQDLIAWEPESPNPALYQHENSAAPSREWLIVSASILQGFGLSDPKLFAWLRARRPLAQPGHSSFVYDISSDGLSHFNIGKIYMRSGHPALALRQFERASRLEPDQPFPLLALGDVYASLGQTDKAVLAYQQAQNRTRDPRYRLLRPVILERLKNSGGMPSGRASAAPRV